MSQPESLRTPAGKLSELLNGYNWGDGGWLSCIVDGNDKIIVVITRGLRPDESRIIPEHQDGIPVEVVVGGIPQML